MRPSHGLARRLRLAGIRLTLSAFARARADRWLPHPGDVQGFVVTLHHVQPAQPAAFRPNSHLSVTPDFLERFVTTLRDDGWRFVALETLVESGADTPDGRRIAVTLDDGYRDNFDHAWPVFRRNRVPFTIFVTPGFCDATAELWWEALERIVAGADEIVPAGEGPGRLPARTPDEKTEAFWAWLAWLTREADEDRQRAAIRALAARHDLDLSRLARELVMSWEAVAEIARDPLCTIGAHTLTHRALARLPAEGARAEMAGSADRIAAEIGVRPRVIAFPYGYPAAAGPREAALAEAAGFAASFTTQPGYVRSGASRHGLPRVSLNGDFQDLAAVRALLTPGFWTLRARLMARANRTQAAPPLHPVPASGR